MANILSIVQRFQSNSFSVSSRFMTTDIAPIMIARAIAISGKGKRLAARHERRVGWGGGVGWGWGVFCAAAVTTEYLTLPG